ncbi:MAG: hypothetical protein K2W95_34230 [Candidatus Obscuribacterales bacterium]|nr:hypothetical protein [Candidatus Obscuribacterales bacterium]
MNLRYPIHALGTLLMVLTLTGCSNDLQVEDLAVAKMPVSEMQATNYLPLNADKPGSFVTVQNYLVPGKYTLVQFFSPYDGVSPLIEQQLIQLSQSRQDLAIRTVNVNRPDVQGIDWQSPALQMARVSKLPFYMIFDPARNLRAQSRPAEEQVKQWLSAPIR